MITDTHTLIRKRFIFKIRDVWYQDQQKFNDADIVYYMNVNNAVGEDNSEHFTLLNDLYQDEETIFGNFSKTTRYEIRCSANRDNITHEFYRSPDRSVLEEFISEHNTFSKIKKIPPVDLSRIKAYLNNNVLILSKVSDPEGNALAWHSYRFNLDRTMLINSVSLWYKYNDSNIKNLIGRANRYCHWMDMLELKKLGVKWYDMGGWYHKEDDREKLRINKFKEGFGGKVVKNYLCISYPSLKGKIFQLAKKFKHL